MATTTRTGECTKYTPCPCGDSAGRACGLCVTCGGYRYEHTAKPKPPTPKPSKLPVATIWKCTGEAHGNPYIDNCMVCMPYWGEVPVCASGHKLVTSAKRGTDGRGLLWCKKCKKFYQRPAPLVGLAQ